MIEKSTFVCTRPAVRRLVEKAQPDVSARFERACTARLLAVSPNAKADEAKHAEARWR